MKISSFRLALACSASVLPILATPAMAQDAQEEQASSQGFETIVVTARKVEEDLQSTPLAVTALSAEGIETRQIIMVQDIQRVAPGLLTRGAGTGPSAIVTFAIRGNAQNSPNSVSDSAVGIYVDGVYLGRPISSNVGILDVANIQVLRGTQGTLFGRNTTGGAVQFTTVQPDGEFAGHIKATVGNYEARQIEAAATLPIVGEELSLRVAGRYAERGGFGLNFPTGRVLGDLESDVATRATLRWAPESLPLTVTLAADYVKSNDNGTMTALIGVKPTGPLATLFPGQFSPNFLQTPRNFHDNFGNPRTGNANIDTPLNRNKAYGFSGTVEVDLGAINLKSITAYRDSDSENTLDLDGTPAGGIAFNSRYLQEQFSQELQMSGEIGKFDWIVGAYYFREEGNERSDSFALYNVPALGGLNLAPSGRNLTDFVSKSTALFAQVNYQLTDRLRATAGFRYTWDKRNVVGRGVNNIRGVPEPVFTGGRVVLIAPNTCRVGPNAGTTNPALCTDPNSASFSYPAWTFSLDYQATDDILLYARTGGASLSGGFNTRPTPPGLQSFSPEDVRDVEAGMKGEFLDNRLQANLAVFHVWRNGAQNIVNGIVNGGLTQFAQNSGNIRAYGLELETRARPWTGMELTASVSRLKAEYESGSFIDIGTNGTFDRSDEVVPQTPKWTFTAGATQEIETGIGKFTAHIDYAYISSRNFGQETADLTNPALTAAQRTARLADAAIANALGTLPGYGIFNGRISFEIEDPNLEIALWARNMFDKNYSQNLFSSYNQLGFTSANPGDPATYGMTFSFRF
ncbi:MULTISPECIES: TonB-dependent receptor [Pseudomonadota]|uniref:TonB-dependent receptor n=1 Tax=Sphingomonadales TaxID=204457 RepID=UPI000830B0B5|nr:MULTISPECIES: TonB-dependent receptor [Pseudomonadota]